MRPVLVQAKAMPTFHLWNEARIDRGMPVRGPNGERVGVILECLSKHFIVPTWPWCRHHYAIEWGEVAGLKGGTVHLRRGREVLLPTSAAAGQGPPMSVLPLNPQAPSVADSVRSTFGMADIGQSPTAR